MTRKRKNPNPARKDRKVVERGYFHTGNSGISISMIEQVQNYDWDERDRNYYEHTLEIRHSAFGAGTVIQTPIAGPLMCDYYIEAFERLKARMLGRPDYSVGHPFDSYEPNKPNDRARIVDIAYGMKREAVWSPEFITGPNSTTTTLLGFVYRDDEGRPVRAEAQLEDMGSDMGVACDSGSSADEYSPFDIGMPVNAIKKRKLEALAKEVGIDVDIPEDDGFPTIEHVACVLARDIKQVGFMDGPIGRSTFTGKALEAKSLKLEVAVDQIVTPEFLADHIKSTLAADTSAVHLYALIDQQIAGGYGIDVNTFEPNNEWQEPSRSIKFRFSSESSNA